MADEMNLGDKVEARLGKKTYRDNRFNIGRKSYQVMKDKELLFTPKISK
jgi:hypothetical protein